MKKLIIYVKKTLFFINVERVYMVRNKDCKKTEKEEDKRKMIFVILWTVNEMNIY